jgi:hypothetical protein
MAVLEGTWLWRSDGSISISVIGYENEINSVGYEIK